MALRRFECVEGTSNKFWEIDDEPRPGRGYPISYGRIGVTANPYYKIMSGSEFRKMVASKLAKGYREVVPLPHGGTGHEPRPLLRRLSGPQQRNLKRKAVRIEKAIRKRAMRTTPHLSSLVD